MMAASIGATERARARRSTRASARASEIEWFIEDVDELIELTMEERVELAVEYIHSKVLQNISRPVTKSITGKGKNRKTVVTNRSVSGEYPKADTTQLMKTLFRGSETSRGGVMGYVATPLDYGVILELKLNRSFLVRTLREERGRIQAILTAPMAGRRITSFRTSE